MIISIIAAMAENRVIGRGDEMPWEIPSELQRFKEITMGHPVIMGRKTFESIGHPLPGRKNIVITRQQDYSAADTVVVPDLQAGLAAAAGADEVFICGGDTVYREAMPIVDRIYLTVIDEEFDGDSFFPEIPRDFVEVSRTRVENDVLPYDAILYERSGKKIEPT